MNKGYIYKISCNITGEDYYGSTKQTVKKRVYGHLFKKDCAATAIIERGNYSYTQLEEVFYNDPKDLVKREKYYYMTYPNINKTSPYTTLQERKEQKAMNEKTEKRKERKRQYYKEHSEERKKYQREVYKTHREAILERNHTPIECECGHHYHYNHRNRHLATKRHNEMFQEPIPLAPLFSEEFDAVLVEGIN
jgi:hypothetical protein